MGDLQACLLDRLEGKNSALVSGFALWKKLVSVCLLLFLAASLSACGIETGTGASVADSFKYVASQPVSQSQAHRSQQQARAKKNEEGVHVLQRFDLPRLSGWIGDGQDGRIRIDINGDLFVLDRPVTTARVAVARQQKDGDLLVVEMQTQACGKSLRDESVPGISYRFIWAEDEIGRPGRKPRITKYEPSNDCRPIEFSGDDENWWARQMVPPKTNTLSTYSNYWWVENGGFRHKTESVVIELESLPEDAPLRVQTQRKPSALMGTIDKAKGDLPRKAAPLEETNKKPIKIILSD
jgi:hypothetical protein